MPDGVWLFAIIVPVLVAAFTYLLKLFDTADSVRKSIIACEIWSEKSFPRTVADIEGDRDWSLVVSGYYSMVDRIYRSISAYSAGSIAILLSAVMVIAFHDDLDAIALRGNSTMLGVIQAALLALAIAYVAWVLHIVNNKSWLKGHVEMAIQRIATRAKAPS